MLCFVLSRCRGGPGLAPLRSSAPIRALRRAGQIMNPDEVADLSALAKRIASRLEAVGGDEYHYRLARAHALALCDALDELGDVRSDGRPDAHLNAS